MKVFLEDIQVSTRNRTQLVDITCSAEEIVRKSAGTFHSRFAEICETLNKISNILHTSDQAKMIMWKR